MTKRILSFSMVVLLLSILLIVPGPLAHALDTTKYPEVNQKIRNEVALSKLQAESDAVALYVKGFCCPSCGIGVRIKIGKLDFIDKSRFNNGVDFDVKHQLVTVALQSGRKADKAALAKAIADAGYEGVHLYRLSNGTLQTEDLPPQE